MVLRAEEALRKEVHRKQHTRGHIQFWEGKPLICPLCVANSTNSAGMFSQLGWQEHWQGGPCLEEHQALLGL